MVHEAAHQLSREVANLDVPRWIDEGIAAYLSTCAVSGGKLVPGEVDNNTYPIWWLGDMKFSGEGEKDIEAGTIIPLKAIVGGKAIAATQARLKIGIVDVTKPVPADALAVTFRVKLKAGKTRLQTWLTDDNGTSRGAYYVYAKRF